jgi:hypothetical protein
MRIPYHNVCRAFPELDPFSDEQCQRFLHATMRKHWISRQGIRLLMIAMFCAGWILLTLIAMPIVISFGPKYLTWQVPIAIISVIIGAFAGGVAGLMIRDRWLRKLLSRRLLELACPACTYSLLGLAAQEGRIICPECGVPYEMTKENVEPDTTLVAG